MLMVEGAGITLMICLSMMTDFVVAPQGVEPHSYVAIADGHKDQKMANVCRDYGVKLRIEI